MRTNHEIAFVNIENQEKDELIDAVEEKEFRFYERNSFSSYKRFNIVCSSYCKPQDLSMSG